MRPALSLPHHTAPGREQLPPVGDAFYTLRTARFKLYAGPRGQILDRRRNQDFPESRGPCDGFGQANGVAADRGAADFAFARVKPSPHA